MQQGGRRRPDAPTLAERRAWLFPRSRGSRQGIDLDALDPAAADDRALLLRAEHTEADEDLDLPAGSETGLAPAGARLHLAIHEVVSNQLWEGDPPEVGEAADRLRTLGYERHDVLHMLGSVVAEQMWRASAGRRAPDPSERQRLLDALPGSWEQLRADERRQGFPALDDDATYDDDFDDDDDVLLREAHRVLGERGPLDLGELAEAMGVALSVVEDLVEDPALVFVDGLRLASASAVLDGVMLTHRLSSSEAGHRVLEAGRGLSPLAALVCGVGHLHLPAGRTVDALATGEHEVRLSLDALGLPALGEGAALGFRISADDEGLPTVEPLVLDEAPAVTDTLCARVRSSFERLDDRDGMPVPSVALLCQLLLDAPALASHPVPPLEDLFERAGFEVRDGFIARGSSDWTAFERARSLAEVCSRRGLDEAEARAVAALVQAAALFGTAGGRDIRADKAEAAALAHLLCDPELAEAFAEAVHDDAGTARPFVRHLRRVGGRRHEAGGWWCESLVAGRTGDVETAVACVRAAIAADPDHGPSLCDAAWYASDRGDAVEAVRHLERAEGGDEGRLALLRGISARSQLQAHVGRNDPCPCGSGRKYKQCCLIRPGGVPSMPLDERIPWLWEKLRWWLERFGPYDDMLVAALELHGPPGGQRAAELASDLGVAASLVLFTDGAVHDFVHQRGRLLPADEADLVAQWSLGGPSLHEVGLLRVGEGFGLRDVRSGGTVPVRGQLASRMLRQGELVLAHPVFDGIRYQIIGGPYRLPANRAVRSWICSTAGRARSGSRPSWRATAGARSWSTGTASPSRCAARRTRSPTPRSPRSGGTRTWNVTSRASEQAWLGSVVSGMGSRRSIEGEAPTLQANSEVRFDRLRIAVAGGGRGSRTSRGEPRARS